MKKTIEERIAAKRERRAQLAAQLAALESRQKAADRKRDTRRKIVVGAAVLMEMEREPKFAAYVRKMLAKAVTRPQDCETIADLLPAAPVEAATLAANGNVPPQVSPGGASADAGSVTMPNLPAPLREHAVE